MFEEGFLDRGKADHGEEDEPGGERDESGQTGHDDLHAVPARSGRPDANLSPAIGTPDIRKST